jgi:hypothetical protein
MFAALVDTEALWKITLIAFGGGVGITAIYGFMVMRAQRVAQARERREPGAVALNATLVAVCGAICLAAIVLGLIAMTRK